MHPGQCVYSLCHAAVFGTGYDCTDCHDGDMIHNLMLMVTKGTVQIGLDKERSHILRSGDVLLLPPYTSWRLDGGSDEQQWLLFTFDCYEQPEYGKKGSLLKRSPVCDNDICVSGGDYETTALVKWVGQWETDNPWQRMAGNIQFQSVLLQVLQSLENQTLMRAESEGRVEEQVGEHRPIRRVTDYIAAHLDAVLTREELADLAGMSVSHFSRQFKAETGESPMDYVSKVRLQRASELLLHPDLSVREVAKQVGFHDEFYFSRKFKAEKGMSPTFYIHSERAPLRVASAAFPYTDHLLALGLPPSAAIRAAGWREEKRLADSISIGEGQPDLDLIRRARPDLIIGYPSHDYAEPRQVMHFHQIAQTCLVPFEGEWREHLRKIAAVVGRSSSAESWLNRYQSCAERAGNLLRERIGDRRVAVAQIEDGQLRLFGDRNLGTVLYRDLSLQKPRLLQQVVHSRLFTVEQLADSDIDCLLLFTSDDRQTSAMMRQSVAAHPAWGDLRAVRYGTVSDVGGSRYYARYSSLAHERFLTQGTKWLMSQISM